MKNAVKQVNRSTDKNVCDLAKGGILRLRDPELLPCCESVKACSFKWACLDDQNGIAVVILKPDLDAGVEGDVIETKPHDVGA